MLTVGIEKDHPRDFSTDPLPQSGLDCLLCRGFDREQSPRRRLRGRVVQSDRSIRHQSQERGQVARRFAERCPRYVFRPDTPE